MLSLSSQTKHLIQLLRKLLMLRIAIYMHSMLLRSHLRKVLRIWGAYHGRHLLWRISCIIRVENNIGCDDGQWLWVMVGEELLFGGTIVRTGCGHWLLDGKDDDAFP